MEQKAYEELNENFYIQQIDNDGYIYYLPEKKIMKVKKEIAEKLQRCQKKEDNISTDVINIINVIKKQMLDTNDTKKETNQNVRRKFIKKLELVVSTICNLDCVYCYANGGTYNCAEKVMPFSVVDSLIEYLKQNCIEIGMIQFFGGEPIIGYKTISYVCRKFEKNHIPVKRYSIVSNFTFLPEEFIEDIIKYDIGITVSIDGPPEITNMQRVGKGKDIDVYNVVKENICKLRNRGKDIQAIECTCTNLYIEKGYTKDMLINFLQKEFNITNIIIEDAGFNIGENSKEEDACFQGGKLTVKDGITLSFLFDNNNRKSIFCSAGKENFAIFPDGNIYPCHLFALQKEQYYLGSIYDNEWDKKITYQNVIKKICSITDEYKCTKCNARNFCSQCLALTVLNGDKIDCNKRKKEFSETMTNYLRNRCIIHI